MLGGGLLTTMAKHGHLDDAQAGIGWAQQCLSRFRTELADVRDMELPQVQVGEFATFADYFFDGIFVDWYIQSRIRTHASGGWRRWIPVYARCSTACNGWIRSWRRSRTA